MQSPRSVPFPYPLSAPPGLCGFPIRYPLSAIRYPLSAVCCPLSRAPPPPPMLSLAFRATHSMRLNALLVRSTLVGALGGLLFGFDTAVISGTTHQLTQVFHLSAGALGLTVSIALWGTVIGAIGAGAARPENRRPRSPAHHGHPLRRLRPRLRARLELALPALLPPHRRPRHRRLLGPRPRLSSPNSLPRNWRGRLVGLFQINIVAGILLAYASNYAVARFIGRRRSLALAVRRRRPPRALLPHLALRHPAQLALAGHAESH